MSRRTSGRASVHCSSAWHMMAAFSVRCSHSTRPLAAGWWGGRPAEVDVTHLCLDVEELRLGLASLFCRDYLWTHKTCYPARELGM